MIRRTWAQFLFVATCAGTALVALALLMQFTIRDHFHRPAILFYATPWPLLAVTTALLAIFWQRRGQRGIAIALAGASLLTLTGWFTQDWEWRPATTARGELRVVLWNVDRPEKRFPDIARWLQAQDADVLAIAERQPRKKDRFTRWKQAFPGYHAYISEGEMLCLIRGEVLSVEEHVLGSGSYGLLLRTRLREREVRIFQVDITGHPPANRRPPLERLAEVVAAQRAEPMIILGDFNTPRNSVCFAPLRAEVSSAFEMVGRGYAATWPMPVPVLSLDQIWSNARLRPVRCENASFWRSDHRPVVAEFDFAP